MSTASQKTSRPRSYKTIGTTHDGVDVIAPKSKSKTFSASQLRKAIEKALEETTGIKPRKSLTQSESLRIKKREDGRFEIKRPGAKRASAVTDTQTDAVARAKELDPSSSPIVKRVRKSPVGKRGTWRKA